MIEILAQTTTQMQNVYTPLPFKVHLIFCIIATIVYIAQYARRKAPHYLLIMLAIDATFVTQFCTESIIIAALFGLEVLLLAAAAVFSHRFNKALKEKGKEKDKDKAAETAAE